MIGIRLLTPAEKMLSQLSDMNFDVSSQGEWSPCTIFLWTPFGTPLEVPQGYTDFTLKAAGVKYKKNKKNLWMIGKNFPLTLSNSSLGLDFGVITSTFVMNMFILVFITVHCLQWHFTTLLKIFVASLSSFFSFDGSNHAVSSFAVKFFSVKKL